MHIFSFSWSTSSVMGMLFAMHCWNHCNKLSCFMNKASVHVSDVNVYSLVIKYFKLMSAFFSFYCYSSMKFNMEHSLILLHCLLAFYYYCFIAFKIFHFLSNHNALQLMFTIHDVNATINTDAKIHSEQ